MNKLTWRMSGETYRATNAAAAFMTETAKHITLKEYERLSVKVRTDRENGREETTSEREHRLRLKSRDWFLTYVHFGEWEQTSKCSYARDVFLINAEENMQICAGAVEEYTNEKEITISFTPVANEATFENTVEPSAFDGMREAQTKQRKDRRAQMEKDAAEIKQAALKGAEARLMLHIVEIEKQNFINFATHVAPRGWKERVEALQEKAEHEAREGFLNHINRVREQLGVERITMETLIKNLKNAL